jgi:hypothetical protein
MGKHILNASNLIMSTCTMYLETVKSYCYLGLNIKYTGNLNMSSKMLMEKGRKAWARCHKTKIF